MSLEPICFLQPVEPLTPRALSGGDEHENLEAMGTGERRGLGIGHLEVHMETDETTSLFLVVRET